MGVRHSGARYVCVCGGGGGTDLPHSDKTGNWVFIYVKCRIKQPFRPLKAAVSYLSKWRFPPKIHLFFLNIKIIPLSIVEIFGI